jgi:hypothetical protein
MFVHCIHHARNWSAGHARTQGEKGDKVGMNDKVRGNPMVTLRLEIDEALMARLQAKAAAEDKAVEAIAIAGLEKEAVEDNLNIEADRTGRAFMLELAKLAEEFDLRSGRDDVSENFDAVLAELESEDDRLNITRICTFDRRDFSVYKPTHCERLDLLP